MKRTRPLLLLLLPFVLPLSGCFGGDSIDPIYEIPDSEYCVVFPAREPGSKSPWTSTIGHQVSEAASRRLEANADFYTVPYGEVIELMYAEPSEEAKEGSDDKVGLDVTKITPEKLAELTGADWVIVIDIVSFQEKDPNSINLTKATGTADVKLFKIVKSTKERKKAKELSERERKRDEARRRIGLQPVGAAPDGGKWVAQETVNARYPKNFFGQYGETFMDPVEARRGLIEALGKKSAQLFYEHEREDAPGSGN